MVKKDIKINSVPGSNFDAVAMAVAHNRFAGLDIGTLCKESIAVYNVRSSLVEGRL